jgi:hypothetical protein
VEFDEATSRKSNKIKSSFTFKKNIKQTSSADESDPESEKTIMDAAVNNIKLKTEKKTNSIERRSSKEFSQVMFVRNP